MGGEDPFKTEKIWHNMSRGNTLMVPFGRTAPRFSTTATRISGQVNSSYREMFRRAVASMPGETVLLPSVFYAFKPSL